jgi:hypothetical protein
MAKAAAIAKQAGTSFQFIFGKTHQFQIQILIRFKSNFDGFQKKRRELHEFLTLPWLKVHGIDMH